MYQYLFRPGYGSDKMLLEFVHGPEHPDFMSTLFNVFADLNFKMTSITDLWINDEVLMDISSTAGEFLLSKDIWDLVFITAENNQEGLKVLDSYLVKSGLFEKLDVDFDLYKEAKSE